MPRRRRGGVPLGCRSPFDGVEHVNEFGRDRRGAGVADDEDRPQSVLSPHLPALSRVIDAVVESEDPLETPRRGAADQSGFEKMRVLHSADGLAVFLRLPGDGLEIELCGGQLVV